MSLEKLSAGMIPAIEEEMKAAVSLVDGEQWRGLHEMLSYHLGWSGDGAGPKAVGKRIRPLVLLLVAAACEADWRKGLPAAASMELLHNFSLIHDDIEDHSELRRGRPTLWVEWGVPQAINAGDTLFTVAHLAMLRLQETTDVETTSRAMLISQQTCLALTKGQYLDMSYETQRSLPVESYWPMVGGKTAALIAACCRLGALAAGASQARQDYFAEFGRTLGLAFQVQDDILGIWGDANLTGKSVASDLLTGKKSLPVLFGLQKQGSFARRWLQGELKPEEVPALAGQLAHEGGKAYAEEIAAALTAQSMQALEQAEPHGEAGQALFELAHQLLDRRL